ncbi:MAG: TolB family protein, partial [Verrucomicrobiota bacterium]
MKSCLIALAAAAALPGAIAQEAGLVADGIPPIPEAVRTAAAPYMEFRTAAFLGWHPQRKEMLVATRFADTPQLHEVKFPGGARRQLTFLPEPIRGAGWQPKSGKSIVFVQDAGGGENYQFFRFDPSNGRTDRLTDGTSRNTSLSWSHDGSQFAYASTRRTGKDTDIWVMNPDQPQQTRLVCELTGGGWGVTDWSHDGQWLAVAEMISANESHLRLVNAQTAARSPLTDRAAGAVARSGALFANDGRTVYFTSDEGSDFQQLGSFSLAERRFVPLTKDIPWNIEEFSLDPAMAKFLAEISPTAHAAKIRAPLFV